MNYKINSLILDAREADYTQAVADTLGIKNSDISNLKLLKRSVDCRHNTVKFVLSLSFTSDKNLIGKQNVSEYTEPKNYLDEITHTNKADMRVVVVGSGPAGLFCSLLLAKAGVSVTLLERGEDISDRKRTVTDFWNGRELNENSNVQFGLGGAGTFSDGKLTTGINDKKLFTVFDTFKRFGANEDIMYSSTPHIGTDVLENVIANFRDELLRLGVDIKFGAVFDDIEVNDNKIGSVSYRQGLSDYKIECDAVVLAIGHSSRDTFEMLDRRGVVMQQKAFAVGVRVEHKQSLIDKYKYGQLTHRDFDAADYKLVKHLNNGRTAYTFCMCPGGYVTAAASEIGGLVTNGMSNRNRDGENSNSALLVNVNPEDFGGNSVLAGMEFQRWLERRVFFVFGNYIAPAENTIDFINGKSSFSEDYSFKASPTYQRGVKPFDLRSCLPKFICDSLREALVSFGKKIKGFDTDGVITAVETRSSSPVRIIRDASGQANIQGLFPCGEGAGYAGGIVSAAVDGLTQAERILSEYSK